MPFTPISNSNSFLSKRKIFTPSQISGCDIWYDFNDTSSMYSDSTLTTLCGNGTGIYTIRDKSGNNRHCVNSSGVSQPSRSDFGINGLTAGHFFDNCFMTSSSFTVSNTCSIYAVVSTTSTLPNSSAYISDGQSTFNTCAVVFTGPSTFSSYAGTLLVSSTISTIYNPHIYCASFGPSGYVSVDGGPRTSGNPGTVSATSGIILGRDGVSDTFDRSLIGYIGEYIMFNRQLTTVEESALLNYLSNKWNITYKPDTISGLDLWYDFSDINTMYTDAGLTTLCNNGDLIYTIKDKSGKVRNCTQSASGFRPKRLDNAIVGRKINTVANFYDFAYMTSSAFTLSTTCSVYAVVLCNSNFVNSAYISDGATTFNTCAVAFTDANTFVSYAGTLVSKTINRITTPHIYCASFGASGYLAVDGGPHTSGNAGTISVTTGIILGRDGINDATDRSIMGYIGEYIMYNRQLTAVEESNIIAYLKAKWSIL